MPHVVMPITPLGPIIDIIVGVSRPRLNTLQQLGLTVPVPQVVRALIDTGASATCIDPAILTALNLMPTGTVQITTPSTGGQSVTCNQYDVSLLLAHTKATYEWFSQPVIETQLQIQGIDALLGRDVLESCLLLYDGQTQVFTLAF